MIEDLLIHLKKSQNTLRLLLIFFEDYVNGDIVSYTNLFESDKFNDIFAIIYILNLVSEDLLKIRNEYYNCLESGEYFSS